MNKKSLSLLGLSLAIGMFALQAPAEARTFYDQISNNNFGNQSGNFNRGFDRDHGNGRHQGFANNNSGGQCGGGNNWRGNSVGNNWGGNNWQNNGTAYGAPYNTSIYNNGINPAYNNGILGNLTGNKAYKIQNDIANLQQRLQNNNLSFNERVNLQNKIANLNAKLTGNVNLPYNGNPLSNLLPYQNNTGIMPNLTNSIGQYGYVNGIRTALGI